ncbi:GNAT family N-acetyltransferase [Paenibacillus luteus]|uniref:GNAT family N-acetyltransferase n=1 Tax=Paenibacillus luteus TaxID=2545753 RepID=UPI001141E41A|nr:GNAT family N-acetyltransferase [Paenibacillus luteus]
MQYTIRIADVQDEPFLWEMLYESMYVPEGKEAFSRDILKEPVISKYAEGWGRKGDLGYIAVNHRNEPVGSVTIRYFDEANEGFGYVGNDVPELGMAITEACRGKGIGNALLKTMVEELRRKQVSKISLSVDPNNVPAMKLYQRFGFKVVGVSGTSVTMVAEL